MKLMTMKLMTMLGMIMRSTPAHFRSKDEDQTHHSRQLFTVTPSLVTAGLVKLLTGAFTGQAFLQALPLIYNFDRLERQTGSHLDHLARVEPAESVSTAEPNLFLKLLSSSSVTPQGEGVNIYFIDSGIQVEHPEFQGQVQLLADFAPPAHDNVKSEPRKCHDDYDDLGHGSAVAGVVISRSYGLAPRARGYAVRVARQGQTQLSPIALTGAYDVIYRHLMCQSLDQRHKSVVNVSLGTSPSVMKNLMLSRLASTGAFIVTSAGNEARDVSQVRHSHPQRHSNVLTVGALEPQTFTLCSFSNYGRDVDLLAPGSTIATVDHKNMWFPRRKSGTSLAAPFVTGVVAVLLSQASERLSPKDIRMKLDQISSRCVHHLGRDYLGIQKKVLEAFLRQK